MGPRGARCAAIVTVLVLAIAPIARLACAAACAAPRGSSAEVHVLHCASGKASAAPGAARWSPDHRSGCADAHAAVASTLSARIGTDDALVTVSRPQPIGPVTVPVHPVRRAPLSLAPPGHDGHVRPLRI